MFKRSLSLLLCLVLMFSAVPWSALAVEGSPVKTITLPESPETDAVTEPVVSQTPVSTKSPTPQSDFVFVEPGKENDSPVGDVIITDQAYRVQMNPDMQSYTIVEYFGSEKNVVIPSTYNGLPITRIGSYAFLNRTAVQTVRIPESVTRMETDVFAGCKSLQYNEYNGGKYLGSENNAYYYYCGPVEDKKATITEATMHPDTKLIAAFAFRDCENLRSVVVPDGVKQVGYGMVFGCELESIILPFVGELGTEKNPQFGWPFGARSFGGNISYVPMSLKTVVITGGADGKQGKIAQGAFYGVDMIEEITLPFLGGSVDNTNKAFISYYWGANSSSDSILPSSLKNLTVLNGSLANYAFSDCVALERVTVGGGISKIASYAFDGCEKLEEVIIHPGPKSIGQDAFLNCKSLKHITIPEGITEIGANSFCNCSSLKEVIFPSGLTSIGIAAFDSCTSLKSVTIPSSVKSIQYVAFSGCSNLESVYINDLEAWCRIRFGNETANPLRYAGDLYLNGKLVENVVIPESITYISEYAFYGCSSLRTITLPESVTSIGGYSFYDCVNLQSVSLPNGLSNIGSYAFYGCRSLNGITIPSGVTSIPDYAFYNCMKLKSIYIPEGVSSIGKYAFYYCDSMMSVTIPSTVTSIGSSAFSSCSSLWTVVNNSSLSMTVGNTNYGNIAYYAKRLIDNNGIKHYASGYGETEGGFLYQIVNNQYKLVAYLGTEETVTLPLRINGQNYTITNMRGVQHVIIPDGMTSLNESAFYGCSTLESITIPSNITAIAKNAFYNCSNLERVYINDLTAWCKITFTNNAANPLYYAKELYINGEPIRELAVPESITSLKNHTFNAPYAIDRVVLNKSIQSFTGSFVSAAVEIGVAANNPYLQVIDSILYDKPATTIISASNCDKSVTIPYGVTTIDKDAFRDCSGLVSITLPNSLTSISEYAFYGCSSLESITIPNGVTSIGSYAFQGCSNLKSITIPNSVTSINSYTFRNCRSLTSISIPSSITSIGYAAFDGCNSLASITIPNSVTSIGGDVFSNCSSLTSITIPDSVTKVGFSVFYGCQSLTSVRLSSAITAISDGMFIDCISLKTISIPSSVRSIGKYVFEGCLNLESIDIPGSVNTIGYQAFYNCENLKTVNLKDGITTIEDYAFYGCQNLESISIPDSVTTIGKYCFYNCRSMTSVTFSKSLTMIPKNAFSYCVNIEILYIPGNVVQIHQSAFTYCTNLYSVTFGYGVEHIGQDSFLNCTSLTRVNFSDTVNWISDGAFNRCNGLTCIELPKSLTNVGKAFMGCESLVKVINNSDLSLNFVYTEGYVTYYAEILVDKNGQYTYRNPWYITEQDDFVYRAGSQMIAYVGTQETVTLPTNLNGSPYSLYKVKGVRNVVVPEEITIIDYQAFYQCQSLKNVYLPGSVTEIATEAFSGCVNLENVTFPESMDHIGVSAFSDCTSLTAVRLPKDAYVEDKAFYGCSALTEITLLGLDGLGSQAFGECTSLSRVYFTGEINEWRHIEKQTDWNLKSAEYELVCTENTTFYYETNADVTEFYIAAIYSKDDINIVPPASFSSRPVTAVLSGAFSGNAVVENVILPETVVHIGENAFKNCTALQNIQFPTNLRQMHRGALSGCTAVQKLTLPFLGENSKDTENAFLGYVFGASSYTENEIYVPQTLKNITVLNGEMVMDHAFEDCTQLQTINIPQTVTRLGHYAFYNCISATEISVPPMVTDIGNHCFDGCVSIESLTLNPAVINIGNYAFSNCRKIESLILPDRVETIGDYGFQGCDSLKELVLPDSVHTVGVMLLDGCNSVTTITIGAGLGYDGIKDTHNQANGNPFFGLDKSASRLSTYKVAAGNKDFVVTDNILYRKMDIDGKLVEVEVVDAPAKANLSSYQMPDSIVKIGAYAFAYNNTLRSIDLNYVRMVGNNAFYRAENMVYAQFGVPDMDITLPEGVNGICYNQFVGREAFAGCTALQRVNLDSPTLLGVEEGAFADCSSLATVNLGKNIQYIGIGAFGSSGSGVPALGAIHVDAANTHFESIDGVLYQKKPDDTLTLLVYPPMSGTCEVKDGKRVFYVPEENVTGVESYAFRMAQNLDEIYLDPQQEMHVGDYAFANTMLERVYVGDNVVSLGLKRGEGEYTVFADCEYLVAVEVDGNNPYYSSQNGVLFDKNATRLIKYPAAKAGNLYELPDTVRMIASMAFKNNDHLQNVRICSQVDTVGLEAFYSCSSLGMIFFDGVYAPASVLENAFTTYDSLNEESSANPRTLLGYSDGYYLDGENGEYGWSNYADVYNIALCESLPESEGRTGNNFYAVVVVDSNGNCLNNVHVTLTDPNGVSETVATGSNNASNGVAMFYNLFGSAGIGFSLVYDGTYSLEVADRFGEYFTYTNPSFYLDEDMRITYVTLTKLPSIYGTTCGETDINTESAEINKAEYGYTNVELIDASKGFVEGNYTTSSQSEYLDISVIAYCDTTSGWAFTDAQGNVLDLQTNGLYQNGIKICDVASVTVQDDSVVFHFRANVEKLSPEVQIEARLKAFNQESASFVCSTILNIHVFDFIVTEDDVNLDTQELEVDLAAEDETLAKLFGSATLDVKLGENLNFGISVDGSRVEMTLGAEGSKSFGNSGVGSYASYEAGYDANHEPHNKNTYFFQFKDTFKDEKGVVHNLTYNVRFARGTEKSNYFYYRCYIYEGQYENEVAKYFGAVNGLNSDMAKVIGAKTYRERVAPKALLIYKTCSLMVNHEAKTVKDIKKVAESAAYIEGIANTPRYSNNHTFDMELSGKMVFEYDRENGLKPVSSEIHGELYYTFRHNSQFVVWVIPVVLEVEVKVGGEVDLKLKFDENWGVSLEEAKLTLSAAISARVGVGCSVASVGIYGKIGMVLVLDFYPEFGVERFDLNGEIGAYVKVLWYTKDFPIAKFPKDKKMPTRAEMFLVKNYTSQDLDSCEGSARILSVGDQVYKIFYVNASDLEGYDAFNYRKLAIARWNGSEWDDAVILDPDCCRNDASYDLYFDGKQIHVVFTQQTELLDASAMNDTYQASSNMAIKVATISDLENITVTTVHSGESYKYLPTMTQFGDELAVVWAENADNNMFGVSPYNYIDANGQSHVFETTANAVYISMFQADGWQVPMVVEDGLSAVTDIAAAEDGSVCFVVDQNGDLGDSEDRLLYNSDLQTVNAVNSLKNGSVTGVDADGDDYIYYLQSNNEAVLSGFHWLYVDEIIPQVADFGENYRILRDDEGNVAAIFYIGLKTWQEGEKTVDGSAMYAVFCNSGVWGSPVEIGAFPAQEDVYISYFDVVYRSDSSVMVVADFVDKNGVLLYQLTDSDVSLEADLTVEDYEIDYVNRILHITVVNQGAKPAQVFTAIDDSIRVSYPDAVASGNRQTISVPLASCGNIEPDVFVYDSGSAEAIYTIDDIDLNYADVVPMGKQLLLGETNNLLVGVKNTGVLSNSGYLIIRPGNYDAETIQAQDLLTAAQNGYTLQEGTVVAVNDKTYGQFWIVKITVEPGAVNHYEVDLSGFDKAEGLFSIYAYVDTAIEKGSALENNMTYLAYQQLTGVLREGEEVTIAPKLQSNKVEFDIKTMETVSVDFTCGADNSVVSVSGLQQTDYQVACENGKGTLTILKSAFGAPATYNISVEFADGASCQLTVVVPQYYTITWMANGEELCTTEVKHGNMPYLPSNPVNADSQFVGWSVDAGGKLLGIQVAERDTTYYAVWGTKNQEYEITWVFTNEKGEQTTVKEQYAYNKVPEYRGKIPAPANKVFANWDKPISAVTENTTYTAVYKKAVLGSATISNTAFETTPGKSFTTTLQIVNVQDMEESVLKLTYNPDAVSLVDCVCRANVTLVEQGENYLIFSLTLAPGQKNMELADLTFLADSSLKPGETQFLEVSSEDLYLPMWNHILIRDQGDLPGSGMVDQWNVSLDDDLRVNFYVKLSENVEKTAKIQITVGEETTIYRASELPQAVNGSYIASVHISAAQMTDYIMVVVMDGGRILGMSTYTVRAYADAILEEESFRQYHALVKEMLNYGGHTQTYFDYGTEALANAGITGVAAQEIPETAEEVATEGTVNGVRFYGASLVYRNKIALRYYFTISGNVMGYTFTANGKTCTPVLKDGLYYVEIDGILPQNLDQQITLTVTDAEGNILTVTYGPMNYIVRMNEKGDDEIKALLKALYNYHLAAKYLRVTSR